MAALTTSSSFFIWHTCLIYIKKQTENFVKPLTFDEKGLGLSTNLEIFLHLGFSVSSIQTKHSQLCKTKTFPG